MRINCSITPDNRRALSHIITAVNIRRAELGLREASQSEVVNEIIARAAERTTINLCNVFLTKQHDATGEREAVCRSL